MKLEKLKDKKILILGWGKEGRDTFKFLKRLYPKKEIVVTDVKFDKNYLKTIKNYDVVIKSPGIPVHLPEIEKAYKKGKITSATEIFFENCPGRIIGITGTKGKSTTTFWIYQLLKKGGLPIKLIGNIGKPGLSYLLKAKKEDIFVYELSSHQLYGLKKSPYIAVLLNIYPEHLDYYRSFKEYASAKANITKYQTKKDYFIYNAEDKICQKIAKRSQAQKLPIRGKYYEQNLAVVAKIAQLFQLPLPKKFKFKTLPHRLEFVGEFKRIRFYNDSLSTIPETTILALDCLGKDVQTLILGGFDRGQEFGDLAKRTLSSKIKNVILFPPSGTRIWEALLTANGKMLPNYFFVDNMSRAVKLAYQHTKEGKICLLSPSAASFGLFKNYQERGNLFKKYVREYGRQ